MNTVCVSFVGASSQIPCARYREECKVSLSINSPGEFKYAVVAYDGVEQEST